MNLYINIITIKRYNLMLSIPLCLFCWAVNLNLAWTYYFTGDKEQELIGFKKEYRKFFAKCIYVYIKILASLLKYWKVLAKCNNEYKKKNMLLFSSVHWTINVLQGTRKTRPCILGPPVRGIIFALITRNCIVQASWSPAPWCRSPCPSFGPEPPPPGSLPAS